MAKIIRPEFGITYAPVGEMYQGTEIYWLTMALEIPMLEFDPPVPLAIQIEQQKFTSQNCSRFKPALQSHTRRNKNTKSVEEFRSTLLKELDGVKADLETQAYSKFKQIVNALPFNQTTTQNTQSDTLLYDVCQIIFPSITAALEDEDALQKEIIEIFEQKIPATLALLSEHTTRYEQQDSEIGWNNYISKLYGRIKRSAQFVGDTIDYHMDNKVMPVIKYVTHTVHYYTPNIVKDGVNSVLNTVHYYTPTSVKNTAHRIKRSIVDYLDAKERVKRQLLGLAGLLMQGVSTAYSMKKEHAMHQSIKMIERMNNKEFRVLHGQMGAVAKHVWQNSKTFSGEIKTMKKSLNGLTYWMTSTIERWMMTVSNAIKFLASILGEFSLGQHRNIMKHEAFKNEATQFLSSLDSLSLGHLSNAIISPYLLRARLMEVKEDIEERFPQYDMVFETLDQYYDTPLIQYEYAGGRTIAVQIPIPLKPKNQQKTILYEINTNFVPYNLDEQEEKPYTDTSFTKLNLEHNMMGVAEAGFEYIMLNTNELKECLKIHGTFFCPNMFLVQHRNKDRCETALFWDEELHVIRDLCKFNYYYDISPPPQIITTNQEVFLANVPLPWIFKCEGEDHPDNVIHGHPYRIMTKDYLCGCSLEAGEYSIYNNPSYCQGEGKRMDYTTNGALYIHYKDRISKYLHGFQFAKPVTMHFDEVKIVTETENNILPDDIPYFSEDFEENMIPLEETLALVETSESYYKTKGDKALTMNNLRSWFSGENSIFGTLLIGFILTCITILIVIGIMFLVAKYGKQLKQFGHKYQLLPLTAMAHGVQAQTNIDYFPISWKLTMHQIGIHILIIILIFLTYYAIRMFKNWYYTHVLDTKYFQDPIGNQYSHLYLWLGDTIHNHLQLYIGSILGHPGQICYDNSCNKKAIELNINYKIGWFVDTVTIDYGDVAFKYIDNQENFYPDTLVYVPFWKRSMIKKHVERHNGYSTMHLRILFSNSWYVMEKSNDTKDQLLVYSHPDSTSDLEEVEEIQPIEIQQPMTQAKAKTAKYLAEQAKAIRDRYYNKVPTKDIRPGCVRVIPNYVKLDPDTNQPMDDPVYAEINIPPKSEAIVTEASDTE